MKQNWKLLLLIALLSGAIAYGGPITPTTEITLGPVQSVYQDGNTALPDSMRVSVFRNSSQVFDDWFNSGDLDCSVWNTHWLIFSDAFQDIDGAGGDGHYSVMVMAYDKDSALYTPYYWSFEVGIVFDPSNDAVATVTSVSELAANAIGVGDIATGAITADAIAADAIGSSEIATDAVGSAEWATGASTELYTYFSVTNDMALGSDIPAKVTLVDSSAGDISYTANNSLILADIKYWMGLYLTMWPGCKAYYDVSANYDDIHLVDTLGDTIITQRWHHVGGAAGDTPDTVRGIAP